MAQLRCAIFLYHLKFAAMTLRALRLCVQIIPR
jgi:hypothetical protein